MVDHSTIPVIVTTTTTTMTTTKKKKKNQARGIENVSGVSCHISCALQLLAHCVPPLVELFVSISQSQSKSSQNNSSMILYERNNHTGNTIHTDNIRSGDHPLIEELGRVLCALKQNEEDQEFEQEDHSAASPPPPPPPPPPLDPTKFYDLLERDEARLLNPQDVGDVSTAVYQLWQILSRSSPSSSSSSSRSTSTSTNSGSTGTGTGTGSAWKAVVDYLVLSGQTRQVICGRKRLSKLDDHDDDDDDDDTSSVLLIRRKYGKEKRMACPFPLSLSGGKTTATTTATTTTTNKDEEEEEEEEECSIESALRDLCQGTAGSRLEGYDWESQSKDLYTEERQVVGDGDDFSKDITAAAADDPFWVAVGDDWMTTKSMQILQIPRYFFLTLDRFSYTAEGERIWKHPRGMAIPTQLNLSEWLLWSSSSRGGGGSGGSGGSSGNLQLKGGVLHVSEDDDSIDEEGHYVTLVSICNHDDNSSSASSSASQSSWTLIDDDTCQPVDSETALRWLSGAPHRDESGGGGGTIYYCAVLLVYGPEKSTDVTNSSEWSQLATNLRESYEMTAKENETRTISASSSTGTGTGTVDWSAPPESLIGRALKVRWAKGTFYEGIVDNFDPTTGKHRVRYKDGDVKEYTLSKKTIEWL